jgi:glycosyltransferase involved in cell wall biosynthesis
LHIGFLTPEYLLPGHNDGGLANYIYKVAHALTLRGHRVTVFVYSYRDHEWNHGQVKIIEVKSVKSPHMKFPTKLGKVINVFFPVFTQILTTRRLARHVWEQHRKEPFDILQTSSYEAPGFALRKNGLIPLVCRISSYTPVVRSAYGTRRSLSEYIRDWLEIRQVIDADAAFSPSQYSISQFERMESFEPDLIRTPVDVIKIEADESLYDQELSGIRYLLFVGTLSKIKGVDLLADAIPAIIRSQPEAHFVLIGRDDGLPDGSKMIDYILSKNKDHANRIHYIPAVPKTQLYPIIAHALGVLMPSRVDNYPNVCLEAQMLGVPVIGTRNSSLEEMIEDGKTGYLVENGNSKDLSAAAIKLMTMDEVEYQKMKQANLESVNSISKEDRVGQLIDYYREVLRRFNERR